MTWELRSVGRRPLTVNQARRIHRHAWRRLTLAERAEWTRLAQEARLPRNLHRVHFTVLPLQRDRRWTTDPAAVAPAAKAAIDGLVDYGLIADDTGAHVSAITFLPPLVCDEDGLCLKISLEAA